MKIAMISVAPPFRGGISKHSSILIRELKKKHNVELINYSRQYPSFIFPGKTQYISGEKKYNSEMLLDSINPISWYFVARRLILSNPDLIIFRFWNPFFAISLNIIAKLIKFKSPQIKLISLCDNILPHEAFPLSKYLTVSLFNKLDGHLVQSIQTKNELQNIIDKPIYKKCYHPIYSNYPDKIDKNKAKEILDVNCKNIILFFGIIRDYKGFDILLKAIHKLSSIKKDFHLLVAGECYGNSEKYYQLIKKLKIEKYITWHDYYIDESDVSLYFSASSIVVLPYRTASQSGITQLAYNYDTPVIVSNLDGLTEVVEDGKSGFIFDLKSVDSLVNVLYNSIEKDKIASMSKYINSYKKKFSWDNFVKGIEELYRSLCSQK